MKIIAIFLALGLWAIHSVFAVNDPICVTAVFFDVTQLPPDDLVKIPVRVADVGELNQDRHRELLAIHVVTGPAGGRGSNVFTGHDAFALAYVAGTKGVYIGQYDFSPKFGSGRTIHEDGSGSPRATAPINLERSVLQGTQVILNSLSWSDSNYEDAQFRASDLLVSDVDICSP